jgi:hypothetical protein
MALTPQEEERLQNAEQLAQENQRLLNGSASKAMLNRLLVLANEEIARLRTRLGNLESQVETLIDLAQKLQ